MKSDDAEKIYANDKVAAQRIREENEKRKLEGNRLGADITNGKTVSVQMDGERSDIKKSHTSPTHTREQRAKMSGVSSGTISRYDIVMKSDDEELKKSMLMTKLQLLETNIRQRGDVGGSAKKVGLRIKELERLYGIEHGNNQYGCDKMSTPQKTQEQLASDMGMDVKTLQRYKVCLCSAAAKI